MRNTTGILLNKKIGREKTNKDFLQNKKSNQSLYPMGLGYFIVNPTKKEYFNPALAGGYLRRNNLFKEELHLYAIEALLFNYWNENLDLIDYNLCSWNGDKTTILSDNDWIYPHEYQNSNPQSSCFQINDFRDITNDLIFYLLDKNDEFVNKYIPSLVLNSKQFKIIVDHLEQFNNYEILRCINNHFGKNWKKKYWKENSIQ